MAETTATSGQLQPILREIQDGAIAWVSTESIGRLLITTMGEEPLPSLNVILPEGLLERVREEFYFTSRLCDHIESGQITLRAIPNQPPDCRIVTDERVFLVASAGDDLCVFQTDATAFLAAALEQARTQWNEAQAVSLSTPGFTRLQATSRDRLGPAFERDFTRIIAATDQQSGKFDVDVVEQCLLLGAKHEELFYDIATWGEDIGIASKATFTRRKTNLTDQGLLESDAVPVAVGRPRHRLLLGPDIGSGESDTVVRSILDCDPDEPHPP